ncbi:MAG TPA: hypothetical protein VJU59_28290 [Paraburkholderia sp.]|uniref:hypothetical protein n=1 Tax=Paraburkholderia sp. TaxID=1926495 RepID=UPI002B45F4FC|nr:hypothetical protein [Paraburkholderia sp.]HKR43535.1 hypothetical protein [Paraburkholderia sp.]
MGYYIRTFATLNHEGSQVWKIEDDVAIRIGVSNPERGPGCYFKTEPGESIRDALRRQTPWFEPNGECPFHKTTLQPGTFYPRMARLISTLLNLPAGVLEHGEKQTLSRSHSVN